ncbi:HEAT repeat domain-containing protein [Halorubrum sp. BV1]|uniref:HEAT repeat domain-containing protein n=1 Tax=Halorubrum sp. BV1 TaxID=1498500 RepID=UPI0009B5B8EA|nr:HEAT repeat domain-containing protein [Halorubrum sp. BV1]
MSGSDDRDGEVGRDGRRDRSGADSRPEAFALLDGRNDAATRKEAAAALGNPSSSMTASERAIADRLLRVALTDDDAAVRAAAIDSLYFHGDRYLDELVRRVATQIEKRESADERGPEELFARWLTSEFGEYRMVGATGLASYGTDRSVAVVRDAFDDGDPRVRARSVRAYADLGGEAVEPIRGLLGTANTLVRRAAVDALVAIGTGDAVDLLATAVDVGDERLRRLAVERLHDVDRRDAAAVLFDALDDPSPSVRHAAAVSVVRLVAEGEAIRGRDARERLVPTGDEGTGAASRAPDGDDTDVQRLLAGIVTGERPDRATAKTERCAAWLLGELAVATRTGDESGSDGEADGDDRTGGREEADGDDGTGDREEADGDGTGSGPARAVSWLLDALDHPDEQTADIAAAYLPLVATSSAERALRELSEDAATRPDTKRRARRVLRRIKRQTAASAVDRAIEYVYVRWPADYTEQHADRTGERGSGSEADEQKRDVSGSADERDATGLTSGE